MTELIKIFASVVAALVCWDAVTALVKTSRSKRHHVRTYRGGTYTITKDNVEVSAPDKEGAMELFEKAMNFYYGDKHQ